MKKMDSLPHYYNDADEKEVSESKENKSRQMVMLQYAWQRKHVVVTMLLLVVFIGLLVPDTVKLQNGQNKDTENEADLLVFNFLASLTLPVAFILLGFGVFMVFSCHSMDRGCFIGDGGGNFHRPLGSRQKMLLRNLEWLDLWSDIITACIIFNDFSLLYRVIMPVSLALAATLNVLLEAKDGFESSWRRRKLRIALSFMLLAVQDMVFIPLTLLFLTEEKGNSTGTGESLSEAFLIISVIFGTILSLYRFCALLFHVSCSLPNIQEEENQSDGTDPSSPVLAISVAKAFPAVDTKAEDLSPHDSLEFGKIENRVAETDSSNSKDVSVEF